MGEQGKAGIWIMGTAAVVAVAACVGLLVWGLSLRDQVEELRGMIAQQPDAAETPGASERRVLPRESREHESVESAQRVHSADSTGEAEPDTGAIFLEGMRQLLSAEEEELRSMQQSMKNYQQLFEGEDAQLNETLASSMVDHEYADLFEQLALPEEAEQRLREILRDYMLSTFTALPGFSQMAEMSEEAMKEQMDEMMKQHEAAESNLRKQLRTVLTPADMAIYEEYEATSEERHARQDFDMDIAMNAPGMTGEVRSMLLEVLVEERLAQEAAPLDDERLEIPYMDQEMSVLQRSRERLSAVLNEQQIAEVDRFVERQRRWLKEMDEMGAETDNLPKNLVEAL